MKKQLIIALFISFIFCENARSQSDPKLSVFTFNPLVYNPAFAGSGGGLSAIGIHSSQFVGFEGAPQSQYLSVHGLWEEKGLGVGIDIVNDSFGMMGETSFNGNFAYYLQLNHKLRVSFGMKVGVNQYRLDYSKLSIQDPDEDVLFMNDLTVIRPNLGMGFYLYSNAFYIGLSSPGIAVTQRYHPFEVGLNPGQANYYLMGGLLLPLGNNINLLPNLLVRTINGAPHSGLVSMNVDFDKDYFIGVNFEHKSSVGLMGGTVFAQNFKWGYAFDLPTNGLGRYTKGTHTLFVSYHYGRFKKASNMPCFYY